MLHQGPYHQIRTMSYEAQPKGGIFYVGRGLLWGLQLVLGSALQRAHGMQVVNAHADGAANVGCGVAHAQPLQGAVQGEDELHPAHTDGAHTNKVYSRGNRGALHATQAAQKHLRNHIGDIAPAGDEQLYFAGGDDLRVGIIQGDGRAVEEGEKCAHNGDSADGQQQRRACHLADALDIACAVALAHEADAAGIKGGQNVVGEGQQTGCGSAACNGSGGEGVHSRLNGSVGQAEHGAVDAAGDAHTQNGFHRRTVELQLREGQLELVLGIEQDPQRPAAGDHLGNDGS